MVAYSLIFLANMLRQNITRYDTATATPSAELTGSEGNQKDEDDMGMSYAELADLGAARKINQCGPLATFDKLYQSWSNVRKSDEEVAGDAKENTADKSGTNSGPAFNDENTGHECGNSRSNQTLFEKRRLTMSKRRSETERPFSCYADEVGQKVKDFYFYNAINRHKMTTLTPSYHAENYSPDDNRFDLRPFLYPAHFSRQFRSISEQVEKIREEEARAIGR
jgi:hypothetical protein